MHLYHSSKTCERTELCPWPQYLTEVNVQPLYPRYPTEGLVDSRSDMNKQKVKKVKSKAIPVTCRGGPHGCETSRLPRFLDSRLTDGCDVVSTWRAGSPLPQGRFLVLTSVRGWVDHRAIMRLKRLDRLKNPVALSGIEAATFQLVTYCLN
jgi:hypothetical protein